MASRLSMRFEVISGPNRGTELESTRNVFIGRAANVDLRIPDDDGVSLSHAFVHNNGVIARVKDLDSLNGTWLDHERITRMTEVYDGAILRIGATQILVTIAHAPAQARPTWLDASAGPSSIYPANSAQRWLGNHKIVRELGRGGMGIVYLVKLANDELRAAKLIHHRLRTEMSAQGRFLREAQIHCGLRHPNIVQAFELTEISQDLHCLVMEYVDGRSSEVLLREAPAGLPPQCVAAIVHEVLAAIGHAHERQIVHRDIKTANVLIDRAGTAKLTDFGLAKLFEAAGTTGGLTSTGMGGGTPMFAAPEQLKEFRNATPASDIYGVGVLAYRLLSGAYPYEVCDGDEQGAVLDGALVPLRARNPSVPPRLATVVETALHREPGRRHPSAAMMAHALSRAVP